MKVIGWPEECDVIIEIQQWMRDRGVRFELSLEPCHCTITAIKGNVALTITAINIDQAWKTFKREVETHPGFACFRSAV